MAIPFTTRQLLLPTRTDEATDSDKAFGVAGAKVSDLRILLVGPRTGA
jgi:hypothetical protein